MGRVQEILPVLLPGAVYEKTLNVETIRSPTRADKVFKVLYSGEEHILHLEFEGGTICAGAPGMHVPATANDEGGARRADRAGDAGIGRAVSR